MEEVLGYILNGIDIHFLAAFYFYVVFGAVFTMLLHYKYSDMKRAKRNESKKNFNFVFWIKDNTIRFITTMMVAYVIVVFKDNIPVLKNYSLDMWLGLLLGCSIDSAIIFLRNKTKINIFQNSVATKQSK